MTRITPALVLLFCLPHVDLCAAELPSVPDGFTVELVADSTLVQHPMMGCFDERGRLFIAESAGTNRRSAELIADPLDKILMLEDMDGDGTFDKSTVFADKMVFPQGCLWYRGALYTCSSPYLWKLEDTDDDGVCDKRTVLVKSFGFSGNAADIHGPFLGPDGRIYWCDGRHGHEIRDQGDGEFGGEDTVVDTPPDPEPGLPNPEGSLLTRGKAARIFSCRPDGSDVQVLCGGGMDNPVEVDFWETGECIGTVNLFYGRPRGDCIVHWVKGGVYPRFDQQACIDEFPWTGGLLGPVHNYGHVAVSGMTRYRSDQFFPETELASRGREPTDSTSATVSTTNQGADAPRSPADRATFFVTQFNTHKVVKTILERDGASFRHMSTDDFLVSSDPDFHATDVIEDADGSLLVINTGGWFRIGCPTSQIAKPEIAGAIYRIRRTGAHDMGDPRATVRALVGAPIDELVSHLGDPAPVVREAAVDRISQRPFHTLAPLMRVATSGDDNQKMRVAAIWALARANRGNTLGNLSATLQDSDPEVRLVSASAFQEVRDAPAVGLLVHYAQDHDRDLRRASVDALGSICDSTVPYGGGRGDAIASPHPRPPRPEEIQLAVDGLASAAAYSGNDHVLTHAIIHALIRIARPEETAAFLDHVDPNVRRAVLIALDQMEGGNLTREQVLPLLDTDDPELQETVLTVISRHEGWAAATIDLLRGWIGESELTEQHAAILRSFLTAQADDPEIQRLIADSTQNMEIPVETRQVLLEIAERSALGAFPESWEAMLKVNLTSDDPRLRLEAIRTIRAHDRAAFDGDLLALAEDSTAAADLRIEAFAAIARRLETVPDGVFIDQVLMLAGDADAVDKLRIARALSDAPLSERQLGMLADSLEQIGSTPTPVLLAAFERNDGEDVGRRLIAGLESQGDSLRVSATELARVLSRYPQSVQDEAAGLLERLGVNLAEQAARLEELMPLTEEGDPNVGHYLFFGEKASCSRCHRIGDQGGQIAPDLSKIASIRQPRDLLEAVVFPSASFARGFRPYTVLSIDGRVENGLIARETSEEVILQTTDLREIRYERDDIEAIAESTTSIMPQGLETRLSADELRDLLAYLQSLK